MLADETSNSNHWWFKTRSDNLADFEQTNRERCSWSCGVSISNRQEAAGLHQGQSSQEGSLYSYLAGTNGQKEHGKWDTVLTLCFSNLDLCTNAQMHTSKIYMHTHIHACIAKTGDDQWLHWIDACCQTIYRIIHVLFFTIYKDPEFQDLCLLLDPMLQARSRVLIIVLPTGMPRVCCSIFVLFFQRAFYLHTHSAVLICKTPVQPTVLGKHLSCTGRSGPSECKKEKTSVLAFEYNPKPWLTTVAYSKGFNIWLAGAMFSSFVFYL